jgi:hypothetical protein
VSDESVVNLAATWTPNPDHPFTMAKVFGLLLVAVGCGIVLAGVFAARAALRGSQPPRGRVLRPVLIALSVFLVPGLAITAFGAWLL